ncbi:MAG: biotin--[acetyl-CoA-carboxylase] ligase [Vicinamibacterales bacterium]
MTREPVPASLAARLAGDPRLDGWPDLEYHAEIGSTNDRALALAAAGAPEGTAVLAEAQVAGRGRRGRDWFSPPGAGLYLSVVARPGARALPLVTLAAGVALARAVTTATALPVELKWPNDLVIGRPWRKLAGVLAEASAVGGRVEAVVIGIGVNVRAAAYPPALAGIATALEVELGREVDRDRVLAELLAALRASFARLASDPGPGILADWRVFGRAGLGRAVRWTDAGGERRGVARDVGPDGALEVATDRGPERLIAGEVTWERLS